LIKLETDEKSRINRSEHWNMGECFNLYKVQSDSKSCVTNFSISWTRKFSKCTFLREIKRKRLSLRYRLFYSLNAKVFEMYFCALKKRKSYLYL